MFMLDWIWTRRQRGYEVKIGDKVKLITSKDKDIGTIIKIDQDTYRHLNIIIYSVETSKYIIDYLHDTDMEKI